MSFRSWMLKSVQTCVCTVCVCVEKPRTIRFNVVALIMKVREKDESFE